MIRQFYTGGIKLSEKLDLTFERQSVKGKKEGRYKMKKKIVTTLLCGTMLTILFAGCGSSEKSSDGGSQDGDGKEKITIAIGNAYRPFCYLDDNEQLTGYEYDLFQKIADKMSDKYEVEIVSDSMANLFAGVETGKYDIVSHHLSYNEERAEQYTMSEESLMYYGNYRFIYKKGRTDITDIASTAGMTLANDSSDNIGKIIAQYNEEHPDNPIILQETIPSEEALVAGLENGLYDAYTHTAFDLQWRYLDVYPDADLEMGTVDLVDGLDCGTYALLKKGNTDLKDDLDTAIKELREEGAISELSMEWFDADYSVEPE